MEIVQIQEKHFSHSYKARCYTVDIQELYMAIANLNSYDVVFKKFIKELRTQKIKFMVLLDEEMTVYTVKEHGDIGIYNIGDRYPLVFDEVIGNYSKYETLNKDSWDDYISATLWIDFDTDSSEIAIIKGIKEFKPKLFGKKEKVIKVDKEKLKSRIKEDNSFVCSTILALLTQLNSIVYWEEDMVFALGFNTGSLLPLNLNEKTFNNILKYINKLEREAIEIK